MNHQLGQYRAELFDELIARILSAMYPEAHITRKIALRLPHKGAFRSVSIDFRVGLASGGIVVETKAPYTDAMTDVVKSALLRLKTIIELLNPSRIQTFILAIPTTFPEELREIFEQTQLAARESGGTVKVWDAEELLKLVSEHLATDIKSFAIDELKKTLGIKSVAESVFAPGLKKDVVVLVADFCSFSRFVHASGDNPELISSVMARFYRETRQAIYDNDGYLDKYMGDGMLVYWFGEDAGVRFENCLQQLMGIAVNLAAEWQDYINPIVEPQGLRAGAAIGNILFVSEGPSNPKLHAIGEPINIASRLQHKAKPNSLVITQVFQKRFFSGRDDFEQLKGKVHLKNIAPIYAWSKTFGKNGV